jgi:hypothetical protein
MSNKNLVNYVKNRNNLLTEYKSGPLQIIVKDRIKNNIKEFDYFLYKDVGYEALRVYTIDLFVDPYAPTSLREYLASGFEEFYLGNRLYLKDISNYIYRKLMLLHEGEIENGY